MKIKETSSTESFYQDFSEELEDMVETDRVESREVDADIIEGEEKIGYVQFLEKVDEDGDYEWVYVSSIDIDEAVRNQGRGTAILRQFAEKYGSLSLPRK